MGQRILESFIHVIDNITHLIGFVIFISCFIAIKMQILKNVHETISYHSVPHTIIRKVAISTPVALQIRQLRNRHDVVDTQKCTYFFRNNVKRSSILYSIKIRLVADNFHKFIEFHSTFKYLQWVGVFHLQ